MARPEEHTGCGVQQEGFHAVSVSAVAEAIQHLLLRSEYADVADGGFVYDWDLRTGRVERSSGLSRVLGYLPSEIPQTSEGWNNLMHRQDRASLARSRPSVASDVYAVEYRVRHKDGRYLHMWDRGLVVRDEQGNPQRVVGSTIDITERKRAAAANALLAELSSALNDAPLDEAALPAIVVRLAVPAVANWCAVFSLPPHGAPQVTAEIWSEAPGSGPALPWAALLGLPAVREALERRETAALPVVPAVLCAGHDTEAESTYPAASMIVTPLLARGRLLGGIAWASDADERCYDQSDLALATEIGRRVALALENAHLYREAQEAVAERDTLFTVATHDLRNALTGLLGQAQLLHRRAESDGLNERNRRAVHTIVEQATRLDRMISSLLDLTRIREGLLMIDSSEIDLCALIERLVLALQPTLDQHALAFERPSEPLTVLGDAVRLEQMVQNLLSNAIKYSPSGGRVSVAVWREAGEVVLTVADEGIGIPEEALPRLFDRFFRAANTGEQASHSMGVGLYVVKEIVTRHGGTVAVETALGEGSRFTVRLPLLRTAEQAG